MKGNIIMSTFWASVGVFVIVVIFALARIPYGFLSASVILALLGVVLLFLTIKIEVRGKLKVFLILYGSSVVGLPIFALLHNVVSALLNMEEPVFFILSIVICPLGFLVGSMGTIVLTMKSRKVR